jgi:multidrug resistance efflux pump
LADAEATHSKTQQDLARVFRWQRKSRHRIGIRRGHRLLRKSGESKCRCRNAANLTNLEASVKYTIERADAEVSAAKARVIQAQLDLSYCDIYSPSME